MPAAQSLRRLGRVCARFGGLGALITLPISWWFDSAKPLRTVGAHGMLPEGFHSLLLGSGFLLLGGICTALLAAETGALAGRVEPAAFGSGHPPDGPLAFLPDGRRVIALASYGYYVLDPVAGVASQQRDRATAYQALASSAEAGWAAFVRQRASGETTPSLEFIPADELHIQP